MTKHPSVSVIIPAFNAEKYIRQAVTAACGQSYPGIEVIVVDDGSTDSTVEILKNMNGVIIRQQNNSGPAAARNLGAACAQGEVLFFTDSDCLARRDWIATAMKGFSSEEIAVVAGSYGIANPQNLLARCVHAEILYRHERLMPDYPKSFGSYNFGIRKQVFEQIGGFDTGYRQASGEDNDLSYKVLRSGLIIYFARDAKVDHFHPERLLPYLKSQFRHGFWRAKMYQDHPKMAGGDDYTFWKDMVEIPLAGLLVLLPILGFWFEGFLKFAGIILIFIWVIELWFAAHMGKNFQEKCFLAFMMFLRSFARMAGFSAGILAFPLVKMANKCCKHKHL